MTRVVKMPLVTRGMEERKEPLVTVVWKNIVIVFQR